MGLYSGHVELMLSQEQRVPFKPLPGPKGTRRFGSCRVMLGVYQAYVWPMLIHVRLLEAMLGSNSSHFERMLSQVCVFLLSLYPAQKEHAIFGSCWDPVGRIWSLCWAYVVPC